MKPYRHLLALLAAAALTDAQAADLARAVEIVEAKCFICHGTEGESSSPAFPRLAGQHASYLERQLIDYKSGRRRNDTMQAMAAELTADEMRLLGMYFESKPARAHPVTDPELAQVGRFVYNRGNPFSGVAACADCHGAAGHGTEKLPRLGGQHAQYVENQLKAFSKRERSNDNAVMHTIASKLTELEAKAVASYISALQ
ncbi:c-type cytochrome [Piscinibacter sp.]|uniref:c-type cytochrome n=1 Tax=Piscinibacter sp. TaxID=1903157 RepID=UPI0039E26378